MPYLSFAATVRAPYENIAYALDTLKEAGVEHISISVDKQ